MRFAWPRYVQIVWMAPFARTAAGVLEEDEIRQLETLLAEHPRSGVVIPGTGGARKVRVAPRGRGKSGSVRVIYFFDEPCEQVYLLVRVSEECTGEPYARAGPACARTDRSAQSTGLPWQRTMTSASC